VPSFDTNESGRKSLSERPANVKEKGKIAIVDQKNHENNIHHKALFPNNDFLAFGGLELVADFDTVMQNFPHGKMVFLPYLC
jgi:hypothetical protein